MAYVCSKCGTSYHGDFCPACTEKTFVPDDCPKCKGLRAESERNRKKYRDYEDDYVLPTFKWAEEMGFDLHDLVREQKGNCVVRFFEVLRAENKSLKALLEEEEDENETIRLVTRAARRADHEFQEAGGSSRHWVRDWFLPYLRQEGLVLMRKKEDEFIEFTATGPTLGGGFGWKCSFCERISVTIKDEVIDQCLACGKHKKEEKNAGEV